MSRLIIKNLPAYLTQSRLREHFESKSGPGGTLTDVKVVLKPDGTSRRFGFVGYKTNAEAEKAQRWYDKTFVDSSRIGVAVVEGVKDAPTPRPNKRPRLGPSPSDSAPQSKEKVPTKPKSPKTVNDPQFEAFAKATRSRTQKGPSWANEDPIASSSSSTIKPKASKSQAQSQSVDSDPGDHPEPTVQEANTKGLSDLDWLKRHTKSSLDNIVNDQEKVYEQSDEEIGGQEATKDRVREPPDDPTRATILETSRLFLRNLSFACTEDELLSLFKPFGEVSQVHIPLDANSRASKGLAYVTFANPSNAVAAYEALDKTSFQGRLLHILGAVSRKGKVEVEEVGKKKSLREEREAKRKLTAGKEFNWGMLYMNSDAVISSVADRMNLSKADILNPESGNAAVKLALAETHVIQETKSFLESNGVVLASLSSTTRVPRSDSTILVKNIPYGTSVDKIRELFEPHGDLRRVLVPPAGTMAVVEFASPEEGRKAFKAVAYRRLGNSIIYLEKGPMGLFVADGEEPEGPPSAVSTINSKPVTIKDSDPVGAQEPSLSSGSTLFVKNLSFSTTSERLTQVFTNLPSFAFARVQMKPDPKRGDGAKLSMGYGFVGFKTPDAAKKAMKSMEGYVLDGHSLVVKLAGRGAEEAESDDKAGGKAKSRTTKMIVKNVPFEATKKDIRELFGSHGQLKSVRVPKKFDHRSRGFAFLEFLTRHEAENAYAALKHIHLLGRHLVLEWAEEAETDIDELRKKAGVGFGDGKELPGRKRKLEMGGGDDEGEEDMS